MTEYHSLSDEELVQLAQQGALEAFSSLYERYLPAVYKRICWTAPESEVEDLTQEIFLAAMKSLKSFRGESKFGTWLRTLTNRHIADFYRYRRPIAASLDDIGEVKGGNREAMLLENEAQQDHQDDLIALRNALRKLPENYREILLLRFADALSFNDIAVQNGQSLEAAKSLFRRAVAALRKQMEEIKVAG